MGSHEEMTVRELMADPDALAGLRAAMNALPLPSGSSSDYDDSVTVFENYQAWVSRITAAALPPKEKDAACTAVCMDIDDREDRRAWTQIRSYHIALASRYSWDIADAAILEPELNHDSRSTTSSQLLQWVAAYRTANPPKAPKKPGNEGGGGRRGLRPDSRTDRRRRTPPPPTSSDKAPASPTKKTRKGSTSPTKDRTSKKKGKPSGVTTRTGGK